MDLQQQKSEQATLTEQAKLIKQAPQVQHSLQVQHSSQALQTSQLLLSQQNTAYRALLSETDFTFDWIGFKPRKYVDKTAIIADLIKRYRYCCLCRPRRFGKTATLQTIADIFANGLENWQDCAIVQNNLFSEKTYPVLSLSFNNLDVSSDRDFENSIKLRLADFACNYALDVPNLSLPLSDFAFQIFNSKSCTKFVVLIDEYDYPLIQAIDSPKLYAKMQAIVATFFNLLKSFERKIRFLLVAGVNRISNLSIFSGFNNISDISLHHDYANIVGYTEQELLDNFNESLQHIADYFHLSIEELLAKLKRHYNGYCFDSTLKQTVFNTWDINKFLTNPLSDQFAQLYLKSYWVEDGALSAFVFKYFSSVSTQQKLIEFLAKLMFKDTYLSLSKINERVSFLETELVVFLFNAGYLTLTKSLLDLKAPQSYDETHIAETISFATKFTQENSSFGENNQYLLDFPNESVRYFVLDLLLPKVGSLVFAKKEAQIQIKQEVLAIFDLNTSNEERKNILTSIIVASGVAPIDCFNQESQLRTLLIILFRACGLKVQFEVSKVKGRIDLLVQTKNAYFIIELKVFRSSELKCKKDDLAQAIAQASSHKLHEALQQIKEREYIWVLPRVSNKFFMVIVGDCSTSKITEAVLKDQDELALS